MTDLSSIVQKLRALGLCVIPSGGGKEGKSPDLPSWKQYQEKLPSDAIYMSWLYDKKPSLWGIVTGEISGVLIIDVDPGADLSIMGDLKPHVRTPRGGYHYYFKHPGHKVKGTIGILPKIDIRGDGSFVNIVGVNPVTGGEYKIEIMPTPEAIYSWDEMPTAILGAMVKGKLASAPRAEPGKLIPEGERNATLTSLAGSMRRPGMTSEEIYAALLEVNRLRCQPPLEEKEVRTIAESIAKKEPTLTRQSEPPKIISAKELYEMEFPDLMFALPDMIVEGFSEIAGRPKSAKSIWTLQAAYSVALGKNLFNGSPCEKGRALYLGLEDGERRLQYRISKLNASYVQVSRKKEGGLRIKAVLHAVPEGLDVTTHWPRIGDGGIEELEAYLDEHPDTRLIVVDITKRIMKKKGKGMAYDEDYESIQPLQELAIRRKVAILGVHHTRKALSDDPVEMVSGTYGRTGAADSVIVVKRVTQDESRFTFISRDMREHELAMRFDENSLSWTSLGDAELHFLSEGREEIYGCLLDGESMIPSEIAKSIGKNVSTTKTLLSRMLRDRIVTKDSKGKYSTRIIEGATGAEV